MTLASRPLRPPSKSVVSFAIGVITRMLRTNDRLVLHTVVLLAAGGAGGALNALYQILMGRMLGPDGYGILSSLLSVTYIVSVASQTLQATAARVTSGLAMEGRIASIGGAVRLVTRRAALVGAVGFVTLLVCAHAIGSLLRIGGMAPIAVLAGAFAVQLLVPPLSGALQGLQRFGRLATVQIGGFAVKLLAAVGFVMAGLGVSGAIAAIAIGSICSFALALLFLRDVIARHAPARELPAAASSLFVLVTVTLLTLLYNTDIILARAFLPSGESGQYAAASTLAKSVLFAAMAAAGAMFPKLSASSARGDDRLRNWRLVRGALILTLLIGVAGAVLLAFFGQWIAETVFGRQFTAAGNLVGLFGVSFTAFALVNTLSYYALALRRRGVVGGLVVGVVCQIIGVMAFHGSPRTIAVVVLGSMGVTLICTVPCALSPRRESAG